jgi:hypothetical protein
MDDEMLKMLWVRAEERDGMKQQRIDKLIRYKALLEGVLKPDPLEKILIDKNGSESSRSKG